MCLLATALILGVAYLGRKRYLKKKQQKKARLLQLLRGGKNQPAVDWFGNPLPQEPQNTGFLNSQYAQPAGFQNGCGGYQRQQPTGFPQNMTGGCCVECHGVFPSYHNEKHQHQGPTSDPEKKEPQIRVSTVPVQEHEYENEDFVKISANDGGIAYENEKTWHS